MLVRVDDTSPVVCVLVRVDSPKVMIQHRQCLCELVGSRSTNGDDTSPVIRVLVRVDPPMVMIHLQ